MRGAPAVTGDVPSEGFLSDAEDFGVIALCEVANAAAFKKSGNVYVVPHENHVVTSCFFVLPGKNSHALRLPTDSTHAAFEREVRECMRTLTKAHGDAAAASSSGKGGGDGA